MPGRDEIAGWLSQFPGVVAFILIATGWILAYFARRWVAAFILWINDQSILKTSRTRPALSPAFGKALQQITFWGIVTAFVILGFSHIGSGPISIWIDKIWMLTSHVLIAIAILAAGHILGSLARGFLGEFSGKTGLGALPRLAYGLIAGISLVMALSHLGLDVSFISQLVLLVFGVFFTGLALAFAFGAKTLVANLTAHEELNRYKPGDRLLVDDIEGTVVEIGRTGVLLATSKGLAHIPASKFAETAVLLISQDSSDE